MSQIRRACRALAAGAALLVGACGDSNDPEPVNLRITVQTSGADADPDGYILRAGDELVQAVGADVTLFRFLPAGTHEVRLEGLASNCTIQGPESVQVTVQPGQIKSVVFSVECRAVTGVIRVTAPTSGRDFDANGYAVGVTGEAGASAGATTVFPNQEATIPGLGAGSYQVTLSQLSENCQLSGPNSQSVSITVGGVVYDTANVAFPVQCTATTGDVRLLTATSGHDLDSDGYTVWLDGQQLYEASYYYYYYTFPVRMAPSDERLFSPVAPGNRSYELRDLASNCAVDGSNPRTVAVSVATVTEVLFHVVCADLP